jgi:hypothetical protein
MFVPGLHVITCILLMMCTELVGRATHVESILTGLIRGRTSLVVMLTGLLSIDTDLVGTSNEVVRMRTE